MTLKRTRTFHRKKKNIPKIILKRTGKNEVIYGARAVNKHLPSYLRVYTEDYDIFAKNPKTEAREVERALDKHFGGNFFKVEPARNLGTFRVKSRVDGRVYADYSLTPKKLDFKKIGGKNYVTIAYIKKKNRATLRNPKAKFRHPKDRDALNRILLKEKSPQRKKRVVRNNSLDREMFYLTTTKDWFP